MTKMKKLVAALLVLTMVLALAGSAMASCKIKAGDIVKFTKNTVAYKCKEGEPTKTIVRRDSYAQVKSVSGDWVKLYLDICDDTVTRWFKVDNLKVVKDGKYLETLDVTIPIYVVYCQGGLNMSSKLMKMDDKDAEEFDFNNWRISPDCYKHVKATANVWLHKENSLHKNSGDALRKDDIVSYRRKWGYDTRFAIFYGVKYKGKCLWVSSNYTKLVK